MCHVTCHMESVSVSGGKKAFRSALLKEASSRLKSCLFALVLENTSIPRPAHIEALSVWENKNRYNFRCGGFFMSESACESEIRRTHIASYPVFPDN